MFLCTSFRPSFGGPFGFFWLIQSVTGWGALKNRGWPPLSISSLLLKRHWCDCLLRYTFSSNHNAHNSSCGLFLGASDPLIDRSYKNLSIKGFEAQKQRPHEFLWSLWFDEKVYLDCLLGLLLAAASSAALYANSFFWFPKAPFFALLLQIFFSFLHQLVDIYAYKYACMLPKQSLDSLLLRSHSSKIRGFMLFEMYVPSKFLRYFRG